MRALLILAVLATLAALLWQLARDGPEPDVGPAPVGRPTPRSDFTEPLAPSPAEVMRPVETAPTPEPGAVAAEPAPLEAIFGPLGEPLALEGRFRLLLGDGSVDESADGEAGLTLWQQRDDGSATGMNHAVTVSDGRFELPAHAGQSLVVRSVRLAGLECTPQERGQRLPVVDAPVVIEVRPSPVWTLDVLGVEHGAHLDHVDLVARPPRVFGLAVSGPDDPGRPLLSDQTSPVRLPVPADILDQPELDLEVAARGYVSRSVAIDPDAGGRLRIELSRAAAADVRLVGDPAPDDARLRVYRGLGGRQRVLDRAVAGRDRLAVEGLSPGPHLARVELGDAGALVLGEAAFAAEVGHRPEVRVEVDGARIPRPAPLSGLLVLSSGWPAGEAVLSVARQGFSSRSGATDQRLPVAAMDPTGQPGVFAWDAGRLPSGAYTLGLDAPPLSWSVQLPPGGRDDVVLTVGPPGRVDVTVLDARDTPVGGVVVWQAVGADGIGGAAVSEPLDEHTGGCHIVAPHGELRLWHVGDGGAGPRETLTVGFDRQRVTLRTTSACEVVVVLRDGDREVPLPARLDALAFEALDGDGSVAGFGTREGRGFTLLSEPGRYRLSIHAPFGYATIEPREIEVPAGAPLVVEVAVARE